MSSALQTAGPDVDDHVDDEIAACLNVERPKSFFLFAGAGSGKTRSLVIAVRGLLSRSEKHLALRGKKIGVITFTNAACDEIRARLEFNPLVSVSTIHSFIWELIQGFHSDIRKQLEKYLKEDIDELNALLAKGKPGTKTEIDRRNSLESKTQRLAGLNSIRTFSYNPNGDNLTRDSLNHSEVIKIGAAFIREKPVMQSILLNKFPVLLIDESQDTNRLLMESFLHMQSVQKEKFALGLFGDVMQRIYGDGKVDLGVNLPPDWAQPQKVMNHRCPKRVVTLINKIRHEVDGRPQRTKAEQIDGHVRLFIAPSDVPDKVKVERWAAEQMADATGDALWKDHHVNVKTLLLEHHMAAARMGFTGLMEALHPVDRFKTGLLDGSLPEIRLFSENVLPLIEAAKKGDQFKVAAIVRKHSPLLKKESVAAVGSDQRVQIQAAKKAVEELLAIWDTTAKPSFRDILLVADRTGLFAVPEGYQPILRRSAEEIEVVESETDEEDEDDKTKSDERVNALDKFLDTPFSQIVPYFEYVSDKAQFGTHQGVKGLEFPRVMVINDDSAARGFLFKYNKLFGAEEKTKTDRDHEAAGTDSSISRTRRLFYVTCSRAESSLAVVTYSANPRAVQNTVLQFGWFNDSEIAFFV
jgi:DNA helicase II / ATP-dependent DNA helicase PcrA